MQMFGHNVMVRVGEAAHYKQEIINRYGKEFFDKLLDTFLDWV